MLVVCVCGVCVCVRAWYACGVCACLWCVRACVLCLWCVCVCGMCAWYACDVCALQDVPLASDAQENYILLLVLLCVFAGGTLMVLSILLVFCHRCCGRQRRHSRASEDQEKTNTTYIEESQPAQDVSCESVSSCHGDTDADHFLTVAGVARRVSFNENAIYEPSAKDKERGRRYTLTDGDFHHLKKSRLTHAHMQPPALKINTILECDTPDNNITTSDDTAHTHSLAIFQPVDSVSSDSCVLWMNQSCGSALPGDSLNTSEHTSKPPNRSQTLEMLNRNTLTDGDPVITGTAGGGPALTQGSVFNFLSKLRRHASLEGAGPFYSVKKWSFDSVQRAASLDTRGSPRRCAFRRQRAASETSEEEHLQTDFLLRNHPVRPKKDPPRRLSAGSLEPDAEPELSRMEVERVTELRCGTETDPPSPLEVKSAEENGHTSEEFGAASRQESLEQPSLYRDIWSLRASLEHYASSDLSSNDTRSDADSVCSVGPSRAGVSSFRSQDIDDDMDGDGELPYDEGPQRNGRDSVDGEAGNRKLLQMDSGYASIEAPYKPPEEFRLFGSASGKTASERRRFFTSAGRKGTVCESFDARLFKEELEDEVSREAESSLGGAAVKPRVAFRRRDYSIDEKTEALFNEFLRHDPHLDQQGSPSLRHRHRSRVHLRKQWQRSKQYSDPGAARYSPSLERQRCYPLRRGDSANYPLDTRYHSTLPRIASAADEEASEGAGATQSPGPSSQTEGSAPDPEENANNTSRRFSSDRLQDCAIQERRADTHKHSETSDPHSGCVQHHINTNLSDKLMTDLEDRLYSGMRTHTSQERTVSVSRTSPDLEEE
ncbi:voltage-dependent calcium channel beta subunit-associated regulatory protein isoform X2 [Triplophysa rosa]|uniref:voltage-dependent calcium channel beta subunit-associated regulatory protein isoform X2 n=1 Tax=Triplophysa rosa TaxID=992332 RepID=UPI00254638A6|nr:voltage-dependent calcium channel beta subunit-associated regulatory protein isoform X2 [Triplophysa rosa]